MTRRQFVPFESLWAMAIDVPYSFVVRDGDQAWSCGQLALGRDSAVLAPDDLPAQSRIVSDYIAEIIGRAGLDTDSLTRLILYTEAGHLGDAEAMCAAFRTLAPGVLLDVVPVPHFYYDGVVLEVDVFCGGAGPSTSAPLISTRRDRAMTWASIHAPTIEVGSAIEQLDIELAAAGISRSHLLSAHWSAPDGNLPEVGQMAAGAGLLPDAGAAIASGSGTGTGGSAAGRLVFAHEPVVAESASTVDDVEITATRSDSFGWVQARSIDTDADLVGQTRQIMAAIEARLSAHGVDFDAVVKSTSLYTGGSSAGELHDNMSVRNAYYESPGPASTGLPVFGLADGRSRIVVDVTYAKGSANGSSGNPAEG